MAFESSGPALIICHSSASSFKNFNPAGFEVYSFPVGIDGIKFHSSSTAFISIIYQLGYDRNKGTSGSVITLIIIGYSRSRPFLGSGRANPTQINKEDQSFVVGIC